jgi:hypothetical protein
MTSATKRTVVYTPTWVRDFFRCGHIGASFAECQGAAKNQKLVEAAGIEPASGKA